MSAQFKDKHGLKFTNFLIFVTRFHGKLQMNVVIFGALTVCCTVCDIDHRISGLLTLRRKAVPSYSRAKVLESSVLEDKATVVLQNVTSH
jgi:hypothetical protein